MKKLTLTIALAIFSTLPHTQASAGWFDSWFDSPEQKIFNQVLECHEIVFKNIHDAQCTAELFELMKSVHDNVDNARLDEVRKQFADGWPGPLKTSLTEDDMTPIVLRLGVAFICKFPGKFDELTELAELDELEALANPNESAESEGSEGSNELDAFGETFALLMLCGNPELAVTGLTALVHNAEKDEDEE